jgi:hypothetical protein
MLELKFFLFTFCFMIVLKYLLDIGFRLIQDTPKPFHMTYLKSLELILAISYIITYIKFP